MFGPVICFVAPITIYVGWEMVIAHFHRQFCGRVRVELESLADKRPSNVSRKQWDEVVSWTLNAESNTVSSHRWIPWAEMERFEAELKQRLEAPTVEMATIDWIWDEFARLAPSGQWYSDNFRPTLPERLAEFEGSETSADLRTD